MIAKIKKLIHKLDDNDLHIRKLQIITVFVTIATLGMVLSLVTLFTGQYLFTTMIVLFSVTLYACALTEISNKKHSFFIYIPFFIISTVLSTYTIITGGVEGFSPIWILLLPASGMFILGRKPGSILSFIVFVVIIFMFYTPWGRSFVIYPNYTHSFLLRFPMVYLLLFLISAFLEYTNDKAYRRLQAANARVEDLISAGQMFTYELDVNRGTFIHNAEWCRMWEYPGPAQPGEQPYSVIQDTLDEESWAKVIKVLEEGHVGDAVRLDVRYCSFAGNTRWCRFTGRVIKTDNGGKMRCVSGIGFDITAQKEQEKMEADYKKRLEETVTRRTRELEESRQEALSASKAKSVFLSTVSHEIRTPMNAILGFIHLFKRDNLTTEQASQLNKISTSANMLLNLINDVLDISKIESGKLELEKRPFLLRQCIDVPEAIISSLATDKSIDFIVNTAPNLPASIEGDSQRISQVLLNILNNAVKFTSKGHVALTITGRNPDATNEIIDAPAPLPCDKDGNVVLGFCIEDTGIGIQKEHIDEIFKPFIQADNSITRRFGGTGLGLSICKRLIEKMGGAICVTSEPGKGSVFDITLRAPVSNLTENTAEQEAQAQIRMAVSVEALHGKHLLLVEDNPINQEIAQAMLEQYDISVTIAGNGQEAIDLLKGGMHFDGIFMDMQMPVMGGIEATRHIRMLGQQGLETNNPVWEGLTSIPIIAMTANAMKEDKMSCLAAGMDDHIGKPIEPNMLEQCLLRWFATVDNAPGA